VLDEEVAAEVREEEDVSEVMVVGSGNRVCVVSRKCGHLVVHKSAPTQKTLSTANNLSCLTLSALSLNYCVAERNYYLVKWPPTGCK